MMRYLPETTYEAVEDGQVDVKGLNVRDSSD